MTSSETVIVETQEWLEKAVIGLNLCPFAKSVFIKKQIRYVVSPAFTEDALLLEVKAELELLAQADPLKIETTLLIHPDLLNDFWDYNQFLKRTEKLLSKLELDGVIQIASFHPRYQFAGTGADDITNYTSRSPYPLLHFLREDSVTKAVDSFPDVDQIPEKNIQTLIRLGLDGWKRMGIPSK